MEEIYSNNKIKLGNSIVHFCRHAEPQKDYEGNDPSLSEEGIKQAKLVVGYYNLVLVSPLARCRETFKNAKLMCDRYLILDCLSEKVFSRYDAKKGEEVLPESDTQFKTRTDNFTIVLEELCKNYEKILIIGHSYYFNSWWRGGCHPMSQFAKVMRLKNKD